MKERSEDTIASMLSVEKKPRSIIIVYLLTPCAAIFLIVFLRVDISAMLSGIEIVHYWYAQILVYD